MYWGKEQEGFLRLHHYLVLSTALRFSSGKLDLQISQLPLSNMELVQVIGFIEMPFLFSFLCFYSQ